MRQRLSCAAIFKARCVRRRLARPQTRSCVFLDVAMIAHAVVDDDGMQPVARAVRALAGAGAGVGTVAMCDGDLAPAIASELRATGARVRVVRVPDGPAGLVDRVRAELPSFVDGLITASRERFVSSVAFELHARAGDRAGVVYHVLSSAQLCVVVQTFTPAG